MAKRLPHPGEPTVPWCNGWARFWVEKELDGYNLTIAARCRFGDVPFVDMALIDTGAQWSVVGGELAEQARSEGIDEEIEVVLSSRLGRIHGRLHRWTITVIADEGEDVAVPSTVLVASQWSGPPVLGYRGFLERIRIGFDPGTELGHTWMFFGAVK